MTTKTHRIKLDKWSVARMLYHIPIGIWSLIVLVPLVMLFFISFKDNFEYNNTIALLPPKSFFNVENYRKTLIEGKILFSLKNSFILVFFGGLLNVLFGSMTAYVLNRFSFRMKKHITKMFVIAAMVPNALLQVVIYKVMFMLNLTGTFTAPIIIYSLPNIMQVWIYLQFIEKISVSLDESAMIDGASYMRIFRSIIFPLLMPATATVLTIQGIFIYCDMFTQYLYCSNVKMMTATTALMAFTGRFASTFNVMAAGCIAIMVPTIILFLFLQKYIFSGLTMGSVKA
jgi:multiple sugar transport system permease protein